MTEEQSKSDPDEVNIEGNVKDSSIVVGGDVVGFDKIHVINTYNFVGGNVYQSEKITKELKGASEQLLDKIDKYFDIVAETLYDNPLLQDESLKRLQDAKEIISKNDGGDFSWTLSRAQFEVRRVHVAISKEQQLQRGEAQLRWIVPLLVLVYVAVIILFIVFGGIAWTTSTEIPIIGIPMSVILWSVIGSIAAILYRFYTRGKTKTTDEIRWLIARPIIGIVMGALSYLAIISGLFIFGSAVGVNSDPSAARPQLLWVVAFLGGFSDKFFEAIINAVVGRISNHNQES
jgi:hypothetical protein